MAAATSEFARISATSAAPPGSKGNVPLGTVLLEEVAFRGVLMGLINRHRGAVG
ncbi:hypothetical protein [Actinoplanes sp. CA-252034]|uniref:hypothetical protein n=1 Tax=Actinoplanes sp. CA-252034 TaxID=3239906 RepID=UPI003D98D186